MGGLKYINWWQTYTKALLLKAKTTWLAWTFPNLCIAPLQRNTLIKYTNNDATEIRDHHSQIIKAKETQLRSHGGNHSSTSILFSHHGSPFSEQFSI